MITIQPHDLERIPPLPASAIRLAALVQDLNATVDQFVRVIEFDPVLTGQTLRWANSAWSQSRTSVVNVRTAVIRLGAASILKLAIGSHLSPAMAAACPNYGLGADELWRHSVAAAMAAEILPQHSLVTVPAAAFAAALMHDIGKLVLARHPEYRRLRPEIQAAAVEEGTSYVAAERLVAGIDHAEVGGQVARAWKLPEPMAAAIAGHHAPDTHPEVMRDAVHIANVVARMTGEGLGNEQMNIEASLGAAQRLGLSPVGLQAICADVGIRVEETEKEWRTP